MKITPEILAAAGTEHAHQSAYFCWIAICLAEQPNYYRDLRNIFAIPNGGLRNKATAARLVAEGVRRGVPDVEIAVPKQGKHGCFIEFKKPKSETKRAGVFEPDQDDWRERLTNNGYLVRGAWTWIEARDITLGYLGYWSAP